jgi:formyltetrahydrofolate deformylase
MMETAILLIQCPDKPGIVAAISAWIFKHQCNILRSDQYSPGDHDSQFFMRVEFNVDTNVTSTQQLEQDFLPISQQLNATWSIRYRSHRMRMGILVSQHDHCLFDLIYRVLSQEWDIEIPFIISNHDKCAAMAKQFNIPYHHLPITADNKAEQEQAILKLCDDKTDYLVLARYMQILSQDFLTHYPNDIINIHHSFLPSFIGAHPYRQAYERGVKVIGATAHYVTTDLDEGPIIAQMVEHVSHRDDIASLKKKGKNLEKLALAKAVETHSNYEVMRVGNKTIVFT